MADHLDSLLGEQLLPLRARHGDADEPYLLAVDAAGQPVVVEVVALLDEAACVRALRYGGRAARLSTQDLAQTYRGGPDRFAEHLAAFRQTVPATSLLSPSVRGGARLLLVCSELAEGMDDMLEFLLQPGWQVEVLQVGIIHGADGRRIVDVSPVTRTPPARRAMEPSSLRLIHTGEVPRPPSPSPSQSPARSPGPSDGSPGAPSPSWRPATTAWSPTTPPGGTTPADASPPVRTSALRRDQPAHGAVSPSRDDDRTGGLPTPTIVPPPFAVPVGRPLAAAQGAPVPEPAPEPGPGPGPEPGPAPAEPEHDPRSDPETVALPYAFTGTVPAQGPADARLAGLAAEIGRSIALVWVRQRRGQRFEAVLHPDGFIELEDGARYPDPDSAAEAASRAGAPVDGWRVWRLEGDGPTLAEALEL